MVSDSQYTLYILGLAPVVYFADPVEFKLVFGPLGQSNMHCTLDFYPKLAKKETNVPLNKSLLS